MIKSMIILKVCILVLIFIISHSLYSQKESWNWLFYESTGITFNTKDTIPVKLGVNMLDGDYGSTSSVSDFSGNLLFYAGSGGKSIGMDGLDVVWNDLNQPVLKSYETSKVRYSLVHDIVPYPGKKDMYYILKIMDGPHTSTDFFNPVGYDIIDMSANNGSGSLLKRFPTSFPNNNQLWLGGAIALKHKNNIDTWLISCGEFLDWEGKTTYYTINNYLFTNEGLKDSVFNMVPYSTGSRFAPSHNGKTLANDYGEMSSNGKYNSSYVYLLNFNNSNGKTTVSKYLHICDSCGIFGIEFSPDDSKLYTIQHNIWEDINGKWIDGEIAIYQFDLGKITQEEIEKSKSKIGKGINPDFKGNYTSSYFDLKSAPNGKIYVSRSDAHFLSSIDYPNENPSQIHFTEIALDLGSGSCKLFPKFLDNYYNTYLSVAGISNLCPGDTLIAEAKLSDTIYKSSFLWQGPSGRKFNTSKFKIPNVDSTYSGTYILTVNVNGAIFKDSLKIQINTPEIPVITGVDSAYSNSTQSYSVEKINGYKYKWIVNGGIISGTDTMYIVNVKWGGSNSGSLIIEQSLSSANCTATSKYDVNIKPWPEITINGDLEVCDGDTVVYTTFVNPEIDNKWSIEGGEIYGSIYQSQIAVIWGKYGSAKVILVRNNKGLGKIDSAIVNIFIKKTPKTPIITEFGQNMLKSSYGTTYQWFLNGELLKDIKTEQITAKTNGQYQVRVIDSNGCRSQLSVPVSIIVSVVEIETGNIYYLFPNPVESYISLSFPPEYQTSQIKIYSIEGIEVFETEYKEKIDVSELVAGVYYVKVGDKVCRFVKM